MHIKVVQYIRRFYPDALITAGLGELQDTSNKRIKSYRKGYQGGQPDIIIANQHKHYDGLCIELKTPQKYWTIDRFTEGITGKVRKEQL